MLCTVRQKQDRPFVRVAELAYEAIFGCGTAPLDVRGQAPVSDFTNKLLKCFPILACYVGRELKALTMPRLLGSDQHNLLKSCPFSLKTALEKCLLPRFQGANGHCKTWQRSPALPCTGHFRSENEAQGLRRPGLTRIVGPTNVDTLADFSYLSQLLIARPGPSCDHHSCVEPGGEGIGLDATAVSRSAEPRPLRSHQG